MQVLFFWHIALPLKPLPSGRFLAQRFAIDLILVHVHGPRKKLYDWNYQTRMAAESSKKLVISMCGESRANRLIVLFAPDFLAAQSEDLRQFAFEHSDFFTAEKIRQKDPALRIEMFQLFFGQFHNSPG